MTHVVIVGGGFAGLYAARSLAGKDVRVTLIDRRNHHLFQPLLYQVATAGLAAPAIAAPLRKILRRHKNITVLLAEVAGVDLESKCVRLSDGGAIAYDHLVLAAGAESSYFGNHDWQSLAPGLKDLEDAMEIRRRVLLAFEAAERETDESERRALLTFVVVGAGPTGVEMAGALSEIARHTMAEDFRNFDPASARVILVEGTDRVLPQYPRKLSARALEHLIDLGVEVRTGTRVHRIDEAGVDLGDEHIEARTVVWGAGVQGSSLAETLGVPLARGGRVAVEPDLTLGGHDDVYVVGDLAAIAQEDGDEVPGLAPAAIQAGRHAAENILRQMRGQERRPFRYRDKGAMATIGRSAAVAHAGRLKLSGFIAWLAWIVVHVFFLIGFRNRFVVLFEWAWAYATYQRTARVIFGERGEVGSRGETAPARRSQRSRTPEAA